MSDLILKQDELNGKLEIYASVESDKSTVYEVSSSTVGGVALNDQSQIVESREYQIPSNSSFSYPYNMQCDSLW